MAAISLLSQLNPLVSRRIDTDMDIAIVGAGFSGLGMAIQLKEAGIENFTLIERGDEVGGTWRDNHYPGAACDVASHLYSFSFEQNPNWSRAFGQQPEIFDYIKRVRGKIRYASPYSLQYHDPRVVVRRRGGHLAFDHRFGRGTDGAGRDLGRGRAVQSGLSEDRRAGTLPGQAHAYRPVGRRLRPRRQARGRDRLRAPRRSRWCRKSRKPRAT